MAAQLTQRPLTFFNPANKQRRVSIQAGVAELMLLNRLRARTRPHRGGETLERAARIIEVTSRHWFAEAASVAQAEPGSPTPPFRLSA
jgi:hypothetical protein